MSRIAIIIAAGTLLAASAMAEPYGKAGPWDIVMPDLKQASCLASRDYGGVVFTFSLAPDTQNVWSVWLSFYSKRYDVPKGEAVSATFRFDDVETIPMRGASAGGGLVYFATPATQSVLQAIETSASMLVVTQTAQRRFPLDGIDAAMNAVSECWNQKRIREAQAL